MEEKNKQKENKKAITIRINPQIIREYNAKLIEIYGKDHRKKGATIETLLNQFNHQDTRKLKSYLDDEKQLINLCLEAITERDNIIKELQEEKGTLNKRILDKDKTIKALQSNNKEAEIQEAFNQVTSEKDEIIKRYTDDIKEQKQEIQTLRQTITSKDETINDKDETINDKDATIKEKDIDIKKARNDYKHQVEYNKKLQQEFNQIQEENKELNNIFIEVKNMSFIDKLFNNFPKKMLELTSRTDQEDHQQKE